MWSKRDWLGFMREAPWYRERDGKPICIAKGCNEPVAWVRYDGATVGMCAEHEDDALPLNKCPTHRNDERFGLKEVG